MTASAGSDDRRDPEVAINELRRENAPDLAALRLGVADSGLVPALGLRALEALFRAAARDPATFGSVAVVDGRVVGFVVCTTAAVRIQRTAIVSSPSIWVRALRLVLAHPSSLGTLAYRTWLLARPRREGRMADPEPQLRLFDIAVAPTLRGRGVGRLLVEAALDAAARRGHTAIGLTVRADNSAARALYVATGFIEGEVRTARDGGEYLTMHRRVAVDRRTAR